eukprot:TRINITY_DN9562_c0_g3_i1.p1 TRINITY_DN9562_c0_g3~~TRINITY_DN9562_c0_g3_i1.p1  ORF type:complete len:187 (-),score=45.08 TRINITY_DN9562_c0_g3_i1:25-585(-)
MNSLTLESSFYGFLNEDRKTVEFCTQFYERIGQHLAGGLREFVRLMEGKWVAKCKRIVENRRKQKLIQKSKYKQKILIPLSTNREQEIAKKQLQTECSKKEFKKLEELEARRNSIKATETVEGVTTSSEPEDKKVIRLEDCYSNPQAFDIPQPKHHNLEELYEILREEIIKREVENEDVDDSLSDS